MHAVILLSVVNAQYEFQLKNMMTLLVGKVRKLYSLHIILREPSTITIISILPSHHFYQQHRKHFLTICLQI